MSPGWRRRTTAAASQPTPSSDSRRHDIRPRQYPHGAPRPAAVPFNTRLLQTAPRDDANACLRPPPRSTEPRGGTDTETEKQTAISGPVWQVAAAGPDRWTPTEHTAPQPPAASPIGVTIGSNHIACRRRDTTPYRHDGRPPLPGCSQKAQPGSNVRRPPPPRPTRYAGQSDHTDGHLQSYRTFGGQPPQPTVSVAAPLPLPPRVSPRRPPVRTARARGGGIGGLTSSQPVA